MQPRSDLLPDRPQRAACATGSIAGRHRRRRKNEGQGPTQEVADRRRKNEGQGPTQEVADPITRPQTVGTVPTAHRVLKSVRITNDDGGDCLVGGE